MLVGGAVKGGPHPSTPSYEAVGRYGERSMTNGGTGVGATISEKADLRGSRHTISYSLAAIGANPPPQAGWHVVMLDQDGQPTFRVTPGGPSPAGRLSYDLVPTKKAT